MSLEVKKLNKYLGFAGSRKKVVRNFSMKVEDGEMVAIVGKKCSGKSTLVNILTGTLWPSNGSVIYDGHKIHYWNVFQTAMIRSRRVGLVTRDTLLVPDLTIYENLLIPLGHRFMTHKNKLRRAKEALRNVGMKGYGKYYPSDFEDLELQKIGLARALVLRPKYLILDEPTGNLQSADVDSFMELVEILNGSGITVIVLTHSRRVANHCQRLIPIATLMEARRDEDEDDEDDEDEDDEDDDEDDDDDDEELIGSLGGSADARRRENYESGKSDTSSDEDEDYE